MVVSRFASEVLSPSFLGSGASSLAAAITKQRVRRSRLPRQNDGRLYLTYTSLFLPQHVTRESVNTYTTSLYSFLSFADDATIAPTEHQPCRSTCRLCSILLRTPTRTTSPHHPTLDGSHYPRTPTCNRLSKPATTCRSMRHLRISNPPVCPPM